MPKSRRRPARPNTPAQTTQAPSSNDEAGSNLVLQQIHQQASWSGPLPPPQVLQGFNQLVENGAERVFKQFEWEAEHRRHLESYVAETDRGERRLAQALAGTFAFGALGVAAYALYCGAFTTAAVIGGGTVAAVVLAFLGKKAAL